MKAQILQLELCAACSRDLIAQAADAINETSAAISWCPHNATLARVSIRNGEIIHAVLDAPVSETAAMEQMEKIERVQDVTWKAKHSTVN